MCICLGAIATGDDGASIFTEDVADSSFAFKTDSSSDAEFALGVSADSSSEEESNPLTKPAPTPGRL